VYYSNEFLITCVISYPTFVQSYSSIEKPVYFLDVVAISHLVHSAILFSEFSNTRCLVGVVTYVFTDVIFRCANDVFLFMLG